MTTTAERTDTAPPALAPTSPTPPLTPPATEHDTKGSRKREREVSQEPTTPVVAVAAPDADASRAESEHKERRTPAKKNRLSGALDAPQETEEDPAALGCSPPHETKIRQISQRVESISWKHGKQRQGPEDHTMEEDNPAPQDQESIVVEESAAAAAVLGENPPLVTDNAGEDEHGGATDSAEAPRDARPETEDAEESSGSTSTSNAASAASSRPTSVLLPPSRRGSDSDADQEKGLKRKLGDRTVSQSGFADPLAKRNGTTPEPSTAKRQRDDPDEDANPRETKRPTPPPDEETANPKKTEATTVPSSTPNLRKRSLDKSSVLSPAVAPKSGGFMAYASTSSPFSQVSGPSLFGSKTSPWASASASASTSASPSPSPFASFGSTPDATDVKPATKRTGFEAFATAASPFTPAKRPKSPPSGFAAFARSRSPSRTPAHSASAFSAYAAGGAQGFSASALTPRKGTSVFGEGTALNAKAKGEKDEEPDSGRASPQSFGERLRAEKDEEEGESEGEGRVALTEQEVVTGEEDEETRYQVRGKLFVLTSQNQWKERGTGTLRLNVSRDGGSPARLVMRKEAVYTLLLNAVLFKGMNCSLAQDPRYLRFTVIESSGLTSYNIRVPSAKIAEELLEEMTALIPV